MSNGRGGRGTASRGQKGTLATIVSILVFILMIIAVLNMLGVFGNDGDKPSAPIPAGNARVHFIDVGQADCILIENGSGAVMIDAGKQDDSPKIEAYLMERGIKRLDYVIGTHAHNDHMGGMDEIIEYFSVGEMIAPTKPSESRFYVGVLDAAKKRGVPVRTAAKGEKLDVAGGTLEFIDDGSDTLADMNNSSYVIKFTYGETTFLFMGDAEQDYEREIMLSGADIDADVLKVGHHGSGGSSSDRFISSVSPELAVIQVGIDNDYGHPSQQALDRFLEHGVEVYRTDEVGDVIVTTDGKELSVETTEE